MKTPRRLRSVVRSLKDNHPELDGLVWNLWRDLRAAPGAAKLRLTPGGANASRFADSLTPAPTRLLVVVPSSSQVPGRWQALSGDYFFEILASARDYLGEAAVDFIFIGAEEPAGEWHGRVEDRLRGKGATHLLIHAEHEPTGTHQWSLDQLLQDLSRNWEGTVIALFLDSAHRRHVHYAQRLARTFPRVIIVAIDRSIRELIPAHVPVVGPVFLPVSEATVTAIAERTADVSKSFDVSFVGEIYPNRREVLSALDDAGLVLAVNRNRNEDGSRGSYLSYFRALAESHVTLNFSLCNGVPIHQLKSRVLEAGLAGTAVVSDEEALSSNFLAPGSEFIAVTGTADLVSTVEQALSDRVALTRMARRAQDRCRDLAPRAFWDAIEQAISMEVSGRFPLLKSHR